MRELIRKILKEYYETPIDSTLDGDNEFKSLPKGILKYLERVSPISIEVGYEERDIFGSDADISRDEFENGNCELDEFRALYVFNVRESEHPQFIEYLKCYGKTITSDSETGKRSENKNIRRLSTALNLYPKGELYGILNTIAGV